MKKMILSGMLATSFTMTHLQSAAMTCEKIHSQVSAVNTEKASQQDLSKKIYPKGVDPKTNPGGHMQISYESEYLFSESAPILRDYAPSPKEMKTKDWLSLTDEQRVAWLSEKFKDKPEFVTGSGLFKIAEIDFLPHELAIDSTGNVEIILNPPLSTFGEWKSIVDQIVKRYGPGSQQAMVSKPRESAFGMKRRNAVLEKQHLGWLIYTNVFDMFQKMKSGAERYKKDMTKLTAASFDHPFLGPMTKLKRDVMESYLANNASLKKYDEDSKLFVRKSDASFKYTSGPSYRPDIAGPIRWAWEIRNAHKDVADLQNKVLRDFNAHVSGLDSYARFADVPAFDSVTSFDRLPANLKEMLSTLFPSKADPRFNYQADERLALETFRNFSMPMNDFSVMARVLSESSSSEKLLARQIMRARTHYVEGLTATAEALRSGQINTTEAKARVMGLINIWAVDSGLVKSFEKFASKLGDDPEFMAQEAG